MLRKEQAGAAGEPTQHAGGAAVEPAAGVAVHAYGEIGFEPEGAAGQDHAGRHRHQIERKTLRAPG